MKSIKELATNGELKGKKVLLRLDLNVPIADGIVTDDFRIKASMDTLELLHNSGARTIIISHIEGKGGDSLMPVYEIISKIFPIKFVGDCLSEEVSVAVEALTDGQFVLLENLRAHEGEKKNDSDFARKLADLADIYVNEAFPASHRAHASIVGITKYIPGFAGIRFEQEVTELSTVFHPPHPFLFILGGAKFDTKLPLIEKFLKIADKVFIGGALANDCLKAKGYEVGQSVISSGDFDLTNIINNKKVILPKDVVVEREGERKTVAIGDVESEDKIWDAGEATLKELKVILSDSNFVLWNGPLGNYEIGYTEATVGLAKIIAESDINSVVGGGDTVASIRNLGIEDKFSFLSTGGGATLDFLVNETLPGIEALK